MSTVPVHQEKVCSSNFVVLHDCLQKRTWVFCTLALGLLANSKCGRTNYATSRSTEPCQPWICEHGFGDLACYSGTSGNQSSWYWKEDVIYLFICKICKYVIVLFMYPVFSAFASIYENVPQSSLGYDAIYMQVYIIWLGNSPGFLPEALLGGARPWIFASPYQTLNFGMTGKQIDRLAAAVSKGTFLSQGRFQHGVCVCVCVLVTLDNLLSRGHLLI